MKLLVLGGRGMAGHMIVHYFQEKTDFDVQYTTRSKEEGIYYDATDLERVKEIILQVRPDFVINAIGLLNDFAAKKQMEAIQVNSFLPHYISKVLDMHGGKLIHISTDCVFSGTVDGKMPAPKTEGRYKETDSPDGTTIYAMTKALGEVQSPNHITLRTSIIGPELKEGIGLLHWFMQQKGDIQGYTKVLWNGITTLELAKVIEYVINNNGQGLYHVAAPEVISKHDLLKLIQQIFSKTDVVIHPFDEVLLDRTLKTTRPDFTYSVPTYQKMIRELHDWMKYHE